MKTLYNTLFFLFLGTSSLSAQLGLSLRPGFNDELCPGFTSEHEAVMDIFNMPPIVPGSNTSVEYYWVVRHEDGAQWNWQTNEPSRAFLVPFAGNYTLRVQVLYISIGNNHPYAAFWSSPVNITSGEDCE